jgi:transcriptional regulator with XRE-family HTH domain
MSVFSERLRILRDKKGQTQDVLGKALGKSRESVSKYEKGHREPDLNSITSIAKYFGVSTDYILGLRDDTNLALKENTGKYTSDSFSCPEMIQYESYLKDSSFAKYIRLAVNLKESNLDFDKVEEIVNTLINEAK